jgi:hypothetical protein
LEKLRTLGEVVSLPKKTGIDPVRILMYLTLLFLIAKFFGLTKAYLGIDPFGFEIEYVWGVVAIAIGVLYREIRDLRNNLNSQFEKLSSKLSEQGGRISKIEGKLNAH